MANDIHKIKLLVLWDILCQNTDEEHALNTDEIVELLALRGINVSRKILVEDIKLYALRDMRYYHIRRNIIIIM